MTDPGRGDADADASAKAARPGGAAGPAGPAGGRVYHLSPTGDDAADGRSPATAWRSTARANRAVLGPGDQLRFEGGATFGGPLLIGPGQAGEPDHPLIIGSYGSGRATLAAASGGAVVVANTGGVEIRDLVVVGQGPAARAAAGISLRADEPGHGRFTGVAVAGVEISGFRDGIEMLGDRGAGFRGVRLSDLVLHDNVETGLASHGPDFDASAPAYAHADVQVIRTIAYRNRGDPNITTRHTGSGIVLGSVEGGRIEASVAYANGDLCAAPEGPVGIWAYDSRSVVIEGNLAYGNRTGGSADGGGFDLDQNVSRSVVQYNLSYGNAGAGYLVFSGLDNDAQADNTVRFNISYRDGRRTSWYGGITLAGRVARIVVEHNTVVIDGAGGHRPPALKLDDGLSGVTVRNNIFYAASPGPVVTAPALRPDQVLLLSNDYVNPVTPLLVWWGLVGYPDLAGWRAAQPGQERYQGRDLGVSIDPWLGHPPSTAARTVADLAGVTSFRLDPGSALIGAGRDVPGPVGTDAAPRDFWGAPTAGRPVSIGADQPPAIGATAPRTIAAREASAVAVRPGGAAADRRTDAGGGARGWPWPAGR